MYTHMYTIYRVLVMFIPRIYYPHPLQVGEECIPNKEISHYLTTVLRLSQDDKVILFNGQGGEYAAHLSVQKKHVQIHIDSFNNIDRTSTLPIHLGQSLLRGDKMDWVIQKATELGVASITPLISAHCAIKLDEQRSQKRHQHWLNIAISACEQSGRTDIPLIHAPISLSQWAAQTFLGTSIVFEISETASPLKNITTPTAIRLAIGPESGWQEAETAMMLKHDFIACTLGPRILRTETAGLCAMSILQGLYGDL